MKALILATLAVAVGMTSAAQAQNRKKPTNKQQAMVEVVCGGGWLQGVVIARDPDPTVRMALVRDYSIIGAYPGRAPANSNRCIETR